MGDMQFNNTLRVVRRTVVENRPGNNNMSLIQSIRAAGSSDLRKTINNMLQKTVQSGTECVICLCDFEPNTKVTQLACFEKHFFHVECVNALINKFKDDR